MKKLHVDGLLESLDYESFDTSEPCLMGKMTKTPFSGTMERATNLLEIIHTDSVANIGNSKQKLRSKQRLAKGEVTMCVGSVSKVDMIKRRTLPLPSGLVLNLNNCYLVLALSMNMIGSCLLQYDYSFKENNGYSIFLNIHLQWFTESRS